MNKKKDNDILVLLRMDYNAFTFLQNNIDKDSMYFAVEENVDNIESLYKGMCDTVLEENNKLKDELKRLKKTQSKRLIANKRSK